MIPGKDPRGFFVLLIVAVLGFVLGVVQILPWPWAVASIAVMGLTVWGIARTDFLGPGAVGRAYTALLIWTILLLLFVAYPLARQFGAF